MLTGAETALHFPLPVVLKVRETDPEEISEAAGV
jgi:hypothetical protein